MSKNRLIVLTHNYQRFKKWEKLLFYKNKDLINSYKIIVVFDDDFLKKEQLKKINEKFKYISTTNIKKIVYKKLNFSKENIINSETFINFYKPFLKIYLNVIFNIKKSNNYYCDDDVIILDDLKKCLLDNKNFIFADITLNTNYDKKYLKKFKNTKDFYIDFNKKRIYNDSSSSFLKVKFSNKNFIKFKLFLKKFLSEDFLLFFEYFKKNFNENDNYFFEEDILRTFYLCDSNRNTFIKNNFYGVFYETKYYYKKNFNDKIIIDVSLNKGCLLDRYEKILKGFE